MVSSEIEKLEISIEKRKKLPLDYRYEADQEIFHNIITTAINENIYPKTRNIKTIL